MKHDSLAGQILAHAFNDELTKMAKKDYQLRAGLGSAAPGVVGLAAGPALAKKGRGWQTFGGSLGGHLAGEVIGRQLGGTFGSSVLGGMVGGGLGGYLAHGKVKTRKRRKKGKK